MKNIKDNGVTLITATITIVIILILAATTLTLIMGENGILAQTIDATDKTEYANAEEKVKIAVLSSVREYAKINDKDLIQELNKISDQIKDKDGNIVNEAETNLSDKYPIKVLVDTYEFEIYSDTTISKVEESSDNIQPGQIAGVGGAEYEDSEGKTAKVPEGSKISDKETEQNIKDGLVMIDEKENEWVWIEVPETIYINPVISVSEDYDNIEKNIKEYVKEYTYSSSVYSDEWVDGFSIFQSSDEYDELKNKVLKSVYENNGFWVSRYEIGNVDGNPVSKINAEIINNLEIAEAQLKAESMSVNSTLMFGFQWDLILKFMELNGELSPTILKSASSSIGNYMNNDGETLMGLGKAGEAENSEVVNLNDIAGNVWEWTLEVNSTAGKNYVYRGGNYSQSSQYFSAVRRLNNTSSYRSIVLGFRTVIY